MNDSFMKDIVYDLIASKLKIKEMEDNIVKLETSAKELNAVNQELRDEVNKWKSQVTAYINDYRKLYNKETEVEVEIEEKEKIEENIIETDNINNIDVVNITDTAVELVEENKKSRSDYMKIYMRNKREKEKEELKNIIVNKKC